MSDIIVRATAANAQIRAFAASTREMTETARQAHQTSPVATAALGRLLTAGAMMGVMSKGEKDLVTLQMNGDGPMKGLLVTADSHGRAKGYVKEPQVMLPPSKAGKLDVGGAIGQGSLQVIKDLGMKEPYSGQTQLQTGEIAEDLTYYFAVSEQVPSCVGLGVLMERNNTVAQAGGFIIQLMPFADEAVVAGLEENIKRITSVTDMLAAGNTPLQMLEQILAGFDIQVTDTVEPAFYCNCDKERVEKALLSVGKKELEEMIRDNQPIEVNCHFCNTSYSFTVAELESLYERSRS